MKKLRGKSKSGFTLLEVLLATVILVIASTMIMQGFIAVMVLGANNRSFAKSGDYNYRLAINQALVGHATASNQIADITSMTDNTYGILTPKVESGSPVTFDAKRDLDQPSFSYRLCNPTGLRPSGTTHLQPFQARRQLRVSSHIQACTYEACSRTWWRRHGTPLSTKASSSCLRPSE